MILFLIFSEPIAGAFGAVGELVDPGRDYFFGLAFSTPFLLMASYLVPFLQLDGNKKTAVIAVVSLTVADLIGDILSVAVFNLGMLGVGMSTSISAAIAFFIMCTNFARKDAIFKVYLHGLKIREALRDLIMGIPTAASRFYATFRTISLNWLLIAISTSSAVAAFSARTNLGMVAAAVGMAIGMATLTVTGVLYAEEDKTMLAKLFKTGVYYSLFINVIIMAALLVFSDFIISIYMQADPETCALAARSLRFCAVSLPLYGINNMLTNYLQASKRLKWANILMLFQSFVFAFLFALLFAGVLGTDAVWASYIVCEVLTTFIYVLAAAIKKKSFRVDAEDLLMLPDDFGAAPGDKMEGYIRNMDEVMRVSKCMERFCLSHGTEEKVAKAIALSLKELGSNVIKFGFADGKNHCFEYRILIKEKSIIFRLRDDCLLFDPVKNLQVVDESKESHKGTTALFAMAKHVSYMNTMSLNNVLIIV